jgi:hypothetical protein
VLATGLLIVTAIICAQTRSAHADHDFPGSRHWNKTTITFVDSTTPAWDATVQSAVDTWNAGLDAIEIKLVEGDSSKKVRKSCPVPNGKIRLCNFGYNFDALAEAHVQVESGHIKKGTIRFDDVDLNFPSLPAMCHESGHVLGLDHRPQNQQNSTCMTFALFYSKPDQHDFDMIDALHAHMH